MSYRNTMKLFASNFTLVWKQVLYFLICFFIFAPITYIFAKPILELLSKSNIHHEVENMVSNIYVMQGDKGYSLTNTIKNIFGILASNFSQIFPNLLLVILFGFLIPFVIMQISNFNLCSIMYKKLTMNMNVGYTQNFIKTLKYSIPYALMNIIFRLPFWTIIILALEIYFYIASSTIAIFIGLIILSAFLIIINALKYAIFSNYTAICVEKEFSPLTAFVTAFPITIKNFWNIMASSIIFLITVLVANLFVAISTFFAGLILMIPATYVVSSIFYDVVYLNKTGQRYYLGNNFIYNPIKYTVKEDNYADKMLNPEEPIDEQFVTSISNQNRNKSDIKNK